MGGSAFSVRPRQGRTRGRNGVLGQSKNGRAELPTNRKGIPQIIMTASGVGVRVPSTPRGRTGWAIPLLLFAALIIAAGLAFNLANLDTGGDTIPGPSPGTSPQNPWGIFDPLAAEALFLGVLAAIAALIVLFLLRQRSGRTRTVRRPYSWTDVVAALIAFLLLIAMMALWPEIASRTGNKLPPSNATANGNATAPILTTAGGIPLGFFLAGALLVAVVAVALFLRVGLNLGRGGPMPNTALRRLAAAHAVSTALSELQLGGDVRAVILACYQRFCSFLGMRGLTEQDTLTPWELEDLAVTQLAVTPESAESLTSLFEEARYSEHALGEGDRDRAVRSLERIQADLGA